MITRRRFVWNRRCLDRAGDLSSSRLSLAEQALLIAIPSWGRHPDASPIRVGEDFYLTHSSFDYAPGSSSGTHAIL